MKGILVATDFSERSASAVARAATLAKSLGAPLTLAHIVDEDLPDRLASAMQAEGKALLETLGADLDRAHGLSPQLATPIGEPYAEILGVADRADAGLIVLGSHRRNLIRNTFVGTTAERCIRASRLPVLVARSADAAPYRHPLMALDLNEHDLYPLRSADALGLVDAQNLTIVFAFDLPTDYSLLRRAGATEGELQRYLTEREDAVRPQAERLLQTADAGYGQLLLKPAAVNAYDPILEAATESSADLIVVGTKRKQAFDRFRIGSVSEAILRRADMDVLVIPPTE